MDNHESPTKPAAWRPTDAARVVAELEQLDCFRRLAPAELPLLVGLGTLRAFEAGTALMIERSVPHMLFVILEGSVSIRAQGSHSALITLLGRGDMCGEGGLFGSRYRRATARAESRVYALQIKYADLQPLLDQVPTFHKQLRRLFRERLLQTTLAHVPLFSSLNAIERLALSAELDEHRFERGEAVLRMGDEELSLYIVAEGQAVVRRNGHTLAVLNPGDIVGEIALVNDEPHMADVIALTPLRMLSIPLEQFRQLLQEHPDIATGLRQMVDERHASGRDQQHLAIVERATEAGLVRGRRALARIPALCPNDCHLCESACGERFGVPRIHVDGATKLGAADLLRGCQHCSWAPECAEACPTQAFTLDDNGFLFINNNCIGCGACATACPYDAITMIPLYPPVRGPLDWVGRKLRQPTPVRMHPNKCDGCHGFADQACITACPTGSLRWISVEDVYPHGYPDPDQA